MKCYKKQVNVFTFCTLSSKSSATAIKGEYISSFLIGHI